MPLEIEKRENSDDMDCYLPFVHLRFQHWQVRAAVERNTLQADLVHVDSDADMGNIAAAAVAVVDVVAGVVVDVGEVVVLAGAARTGAADAADIDVEVDVDGDAAAAAAGGVACGGLDWLIELSVPP